MFDCLFGPQTIGYFKSEVFALKMNRNLSYDKRVYDRIDSKLDELSVLNR